MMGIFHPEWKDGRLLIQRNFGSQGEAADNFRLKNWNDYKNGFGSPSGNVYWIGLTEMHRLTSSGSGSGSSNVGGSGSGSGKTWFIIFEVEWAEMKEGNRRRDDPRAGTSGRLEMSGFAVASEAELFRLTIGSVVRAENWGRLSAEVLNRFYAEAMNGFAFSAFDKDDSARRLVGWQGGCPGVFGGGWWFNRCSHLFLNGPARVWDGLNSLYPVNTAMWLRRND